MFNEARALQHGIYNSARTSLISDSQCLIHLEKFFADHLEETINDDLVSISTDYNEASYLYPFWQNYPPENRGRGSVGDQFPWIEVGEHALGSKLATYLEPFNPRDVGLPTGSDQRFVLSSPEISRLTQGLTDKVWIFIDIKSVGPRDDSEHTVMSHNQISGDGKWDSIDAGISNSILLACGVRRSHAFHCSVPPLYVLSDGSIVPVLMYALKPVYSMLSLDTNGVKKGQPLSRITLASIPNGILLTENPNYLKSYPSLLFPGKDDKDKNPLKVRARICFRLLNKIADWRVKHISVA